MAHTPDGKWISDSNARSYEDMRGQYGAELGRMLESGSAVTDEWNRVLHQIDPDLRLVKAKENAHAPGLTPGFWHVLRKNSIGAPTLICHHREGEYADPDSSLLESLRRNDLWNDRTKRERERSMDELDRQESRRKAREQDERNDEIRERWHAASNPGVSFTGQGGGWRYRAGSPRAA